LKHKSNNLIWSSFQCNFRVHLFIREKRKKQTWLCISLLHHHYLYSYVKPLVKLLKRLLDFKPLLFIPHQALYTAAKQSCAATPAKKRTSCFSGSVCANQGTRFQLRSPHARASRQTQFSLVSPASASDKLDRFGRNFVRRRPDARARAVLLLRVLACLQPPC